MERYRGKHEGPTEVREGFDYLLSLATRIGKTISGRARAERKAFEARRERTVPGRRIIERTSQALERLKQGGQSPNSDGTFTVPDTGAARVYLHEAPGIELGLMGEHVLLTTYEHLPGEGDILRTTYSAVIAEQDGELDGVAVQFHIGSFGNQPHGTSAEGFVARDFVADDWANGSTGEIIARQLSSLSPLAQNRLAATSPSA